MSVQFSCSVVSDSLRPHESQHSRPPCPSPTPGVHSDSRPPSHWCHPAISSSIIPFSSCPKSFPASESFPMSQLFTWGVQSTGVSAFASFLPKKSWLDLLAVQGTLKSLLQHHSSKASVLRHSLNMGHFYFSQSQGCYSFSVPGPTWGNPLQGMWQDSAERAGSYHTGHLPKSALGSTNPLESALQSVHINRHHHIFQYFFFQFLK